MTDDFNSILDKAVMNYNKEHGITRIDGKDKKTEEKPVEVKKKRDPKNKSNLKSLSRKSKNLKSQKRKRFRENSLNLREKK